MSGTDNRADLLALSDIAAALGLLTRLPVPVDPVQAAARGARAAWAWPLAGVAVGCIGWVAGALALALGLPAAVAAGLTLAAQIAVTGALHEDGIADSADGLWGGQTRERRLEIMKDSRTGAFGAIALVLSLGLRWAALAALMAAPGWGWGLIAAGAASRAGMAALSSALPPARPGGLSRAVGRPPAATVWTGIAIAMGIGIFGTGGTMLALVLWSAGTLTLWGLVARARIGGQTGDILGAGQQLAEITALCVLVSTAA